MILRLAETISVYRRRPVAINRMSAFRLVPGRKQSRTQVGRILHTTNNRPTSRIVQ